jgi:ABC-2 type transport system ATP-binding protein
MKNVIKSYAGKQALQQVNSEICRRVNHRPVRRNGAEKPLFMSASCFSSLSGRITLDGEPITRKNIAKISFATFEHSFSRI